MWYEDCVIIKTTQNGQKNKPITFWVVWMQTMQQFIKKVLHFHTEPPVAALIGVVIGDPDKSQQVHLKEFTPVLFAN